MERLEAVTERVDVVVEHAAQTAHDDAGDAEEQGEAGVDVATEGGYGVVGRCDVHGLNDEQVVVERDDGVGQGDEHQQGVACVEGGHEHEELAEEACKWGYACQGEEAERHEEGQLGVGAVEAVVVGDVDLAAAFLHRGHDGEGTEVGNHVDQEVEHEGRHALRRAVHNSEHKIACLRNGREGHEALDVVLTDGEEVGHGDGGHDEPVEGGVPGIHEVALGKCLHEDGHEHKGGSTLGDDAEVGGDGGGGSLVGVGCPEVEGHEGNLEAHARDEEQQAEDADIFFQCRCCSPRPQERAETMQRMT